MLAGYAHTYHYSQNTGRPGDDERDKYLFLGKHLTVEKSVGRKTDGRAGTS